MTQPARGRNIRATRGPDPRASQAGAVDTRFALLVGVNRYADPGLASLPYCVNDVYALGQTLAKVGYIVVRLHDEATDPRLLPTRDNVEAELARVCQAARETDLIYVHFSCHGVLVDSQPHLCTGEVRLLSLKQRALPLSQVEAQMRKSRARRLVLTIDACHSGVDMGRGQDNAEFSCDAYDLAEGFALLAGSTARQTAQEWHDKRHGVFSYFLMQALDGKADHNQKGFVTVDDTKAYLSHQVRRFSLEQGAQLQEPTTRTEGVGDIILADWRQPRPDPEVPDYESIK